ncbi:hypothetical protein ASD15_28895 [Massilia sp. Root351]|nr:hypothetical protein ASD15_28895 [Massilia sp. Root351]
MRVAYAPSIADPIEIFQQLHGALAPKAGRVAEAGRLRVFQLGDDLRQFGQRRRVVEQVRDNLGDGAGPRQLAQQAAHVVLRHGQRGGQGTHPGRIVAACQQLRQQAVRQRLFGCAELHAVAGQVQRVAVAADVALRQQCGHGVAP